MYLAIGLRATCLTLALCIGIVMYAYYAHCDPLLAGVISKRDQVCKLVKSVIIIIAVWPDWLTQLRNEALWRPWRRWCPYLWWRCWACFQGYQVCSPRVYSAHLSGQFPHHHVIYYACPYFVDTTATCSTASVYCVPCIAPYHQVSTPSLPVSYRTSSNLWVRCDSNANCLREKLHLYWKYFVSHAVLNNFSS